MVTRDSKSPAAKAKSIARGILSTNKKLYPIKPGFERDEYPPKAFKENAGTAHIQYMNPKDNGGSGGFLGNVLKLYNDGDQIELVDALMDSNKEGSLYYKDAYTK
ncbi:NucA/NucB deoxyribonuclease domain-containing protein [Methyloglobulus sp.]|uniref:NucA/NucB deoxyribonuclease domain-containing protein n=1 Tax=Methyloglobulus sp. TaxID=2518622 RepID=UPI0032B7C352